MTDHIKASDPTAKSTEYRVFNLPGMGRVRAPAHMTTEQLIAALSEGDTEEPQDGTAASS